jgi:hypothetical protein
MKQCIKCQSIQSTSWYKGPICYKCYKESNIENIKKCKKQYRKNNKEKIAIINKIWHLKNKTHIKEYTTKYHKQQYSSNINFRIMKILRSRLKQAIKNHQKSGSAISDLGCSVAKLKIYLQLKFHRNPRGRHEYMDWNNYGLKGWHIDHIKPLSSFDLSNKEELLKACHYTNLQPMWAIDNVKKSDYFELM